MNKVHKMQGIMLVVAIGQWVLRYLERNSCYSETGKGEEPYTSNKYMEDYLSTAVSYIRSNVNENNHAVIMHINARSLEEVCKGDSSVLCGWEQSGRGCAGNTAVGRRDSLEHEALEDADLLKHPRVLKSGTHRCGPGAGAEGP